MVFHILPPLDQFIHDPWTNRVRGPEFEQQVVKVLPFPMNCLVNRALWGGGQLVDPDQPKVFGFDGSERRGDPLDTHPSPPKYQVLKFCGLGEVRQRRPRCA